MIINISLRVQFMLLFTRVTHNLVEYQVIESVKHSNLKEEGIFK